MTVRTLRPLPRLAPTAPLVRELVVVGGGPVGLAAAVEARLAGLRVLLVEPRTTPVDKACGEGLMPGALAALARLGVDPPGREITGIAYSSPDGAVRAEHDFAAGPGRGVRRTALARALSERAEALGVDVLDARVVDLTQDGTSVRLHLSAGGSSGGTPAAVDARWVVAADGLHSPVRRMLGVERGGDGRRYAVRQHAAAAPWSSRVEVFWGSGLEAYVTPVGEDEVGVAVLGARGALSVPAAVASLPALAERLDGAAFTTAARGAGPLRQRSAARVVGRVLLAGDAAGYVDALTGEGLAVGMATARAAVDAVARAHRCSSPTEADAVVRAYERQWWRATRSYRWLTAALLAGTRTPASRTGLVALSARAPWLFGAAVEQVGRTAHA